MSKGGQWKWDENAQDWVPNAQTTGKLTKDQLQQAMIQDLGSTGGKNIPELKTIYDVLYAQTSETEKKEVLKTESAEDIVDQIQEKITRIPTGRFSGPIQYTTSALGFNPEVTAYEALRKASIGPLARAITGEVGVLTDQDIARAEKLLPKITDTTEEVELKLSQLRKSIQKRRSLYLEQLKHNHRMLGRYSPSVQVCILSQGYEAYPG